MQLYNGLLFLSGEVSSFDVRPEVINPPEAATLSTPQQTWKRGAKKRKKERKGLRELHESVCLIEREVKSAFQNSSYRLVLGELASCHGRTAECNRSESGLLRGSRGLSSTPSSRSTELSPCWRSTLLKHQKTLPLYLSTLYSLPLYLSTSLVCWWCGISKLNIIPRPWRGLYRVTGAAKTIEDCQHTNSQKKTKRGHWFSKMPKPPKPLKPPKPQSQCPPTISRKNPFSVFGLHVGSRCCVVIGWMVKWNVRICPKPGSSWTSHGCCCFRTILILSFTFSAFLWGPQMNRI